MFNPVASTATSGLLSALSPSLTPAGASPEAADFEAILRGEAQTRLAPDSATTLPDTFPAPDARALAAAIPAGNGGNHGKADGKAAGKILPGAAPLADLTHLADDAGEEGFDGSVAQSDGPADDGDGKAPVPALLFAEPIRMVLPEGRATRFDAPADSAGRSRAAFAALAAQPLTPRPADMDGADARKATEATAAVSTAAQASAHATTPPLQNQTGAASLAAILPQLQVASGQPARIAPGRARDTETPTAALVQALTAQQAGSGQAGSGKPGRTAADTTRMSPLPAAAPAAPATQASAASASLAEQTPHAPLDEATATPPRPVREDTATPARAAASASAPAIPSSPAAFTMAVDLTGAAASPLSQAIAGPAAPTGTVSTSFATASPSAEQPHDVGTLVDRLVEAREAAMPHVVRAAVSHGQFGSIALQFQNDDSRLSVTMTSADPDFAPAVQAAAAQAAASASSDQSRSEGQARQEQQQQAQQQAGTAAGSHGQAQAQADPRSNAGRESARDGQPGSGANGPAGTDRTQPEEARQPGRRGGIYA